MLIVIICWTQTKTTWLGAARGFRLENSRSVPVGIPTAGSRFLLAPFPANVSQGYQDITCPLNTTEGFQDSTSLLTCASHLHIIFLFLASESTLVPCASSSKKEEENGLGLREHYDVIDEDPEPLLFQLLRLANPSGVPSQKPEFWNPFLHDVFMVKVLSKMDSETMIPVNLLKVNETMHQ